uniref:tRNA pseudouridine(55) synthase n=2 Tax=Schistosoma mansoni TaxID=6183 RepID=A0A5K4EZD4_SCHMA
MPNEAISCIQKYMLDFNICKCCIIRLTNGRCQQIDLLNVFHSQAYPDEFICKLCFGLLHNPYLCDIPRNLNESQNEMEFTNEEFDKYVLLYLYKELNGSRYQYTAYQLRVTEPINIMLREQFLWDELICMSIDHVNNTSNSSTIEKLNNPQITFTKDDINVLRSYAIPVKTAWKWIADEKLSSLLKAPLIYSLRNDTELKLIKTNELIVNNSNYDQESNIICITVEFANFFIQSDYNEFLSYLERSPLNSIRSWLVRSKSIKIPRKRSRFHYEKELKMNSSEKELFEDGKIIQELTTKSFSSETFSYNVNSSIFNPSSVINIGYTLPKSFHFSRGLLTELIPLLKDICLQSNYLRKTSSSNCSPAFIISLEIVRSVPLYLAGRYVKLSRRLPQSPWIIGSQRKLDSSVEELITQPILPRFGANAQSCFITSGREDVDVRCLGLGRPFAIELSNYELLPSQIIQRWSVNNKLAVECNEDEPLDLLKLASFINSTTQGRVFIRDLQLVSSKSATAALKLGEMHKAKCYRAVCWCPQGGINTELLMKMLQYTTLLNQTNENIDHVNTIHWPPNKINSMKYGKIYFGPLDIHQLTPIRVLHRRPLLNRKRTIYNLCFMSYVETIGVNIFEFDDFKSWSKLYPEDELFILEIRCEAGTYVKELVHGDLGRCNPSLASIFGRQLDILALDVIGVELDWPTRLKDPILN